MPAVLSFLIKPLDDQGPEVLTLTLVVDDTPLGELIERFEREQSFEPAGGYGGIIPGFFRYGPLNRYFLGESESEYFSRNRAYYLLGCQCGEVGCWPLSARISKTETEIVWDHFAQEHRPERDYSRFGPFRFEFTQYSTTVAGLESRFKART